MAGPKKKKPRQAVVIVHGMGEQRPLETLSRFIGVAIPLKPDDGREDPSFLSRPDDISNSYESRRFLVPPWSENGVEKWAQTEFFEYHWAHHMQGNQLRDMWSTLRKMLLQWPTNVPQGLIVVWCIFWALIISVSILIYKAGPDFDDLSVQKITATLFGAGMFGTLVTWLMTNFLPGKIRSSFVDVVRYLDTSPRSYAIRKSIRKGMINLLQELHDAGRYQRIIIVAHSLGAYIAYDGISFLWTQMNQVHDAEGKGAARKSFFDNLEKAVDGLKYGTKKSVGQFQKEQRRLWTEMKKQGNPWLVTDFVTVGTPMYMADQIMAKSRDDFDRQVKLRHLPTCPPQPDYRFSDQLPSPDDTDYAYMENKGYVLYHAAPFAVIRWTNLWFPARVWFFGDWFGGALAALFGSGINDIELTGNTPGRLIPGWAHAKYFDFQDDEDEESVTTQIRNAMDLASSSWIAPSQKQ